VPGGHQASPIRRERDPEADEVRRAYWGRPGQQLYPSAVDQLSDLRARAQSGSDLAIIEDELYPEHHGESGTDVAVASSPWRVDGVVPVYRPLPARPERSFSNTFVDFTRGLVGHRDFGPNVDAPE